MTLRQFSQTFYFFFPKNRNRLCCCYFHLPFHTGHILSFHSKTASFVCLRSLCLLYKASLIRQISSHSLISEYLSVDSQNNWLQGVYRKLSFLSQIFWSQETNKPNASKLTSSKLLAHFLHVTCTEVSSFFLKIFTFW